MKSGLAAIVLVLIMTGCAGNRMELGVENEKLKPCPDTPNCVSSQASDADHFVEPIRLSVGYEEIQGILLQVLDDLNVSRVDVVESDYIHAEFVSRIFRFVDDVELYFPSRDGGEIVVHIRSASRVGRSDLGVNRKRVEAIRSRLGGSKRD